MESGSTKENTALGGNTLILECQKKPMDKNYYWLSFLINLLA